MIKMLKEIIDLKKKICYSVNNSEFNYIYI